MFTATLFTIAKAWKQPKDQSTDKWIKMQYMYRMEYYGAIKIDQLIFTASMQLSFVNTVMLKKQQGKI